MACDFAGGLYRRSTPWTSWPPVRSRFFDLPSDLVSILPWTERLVAGNLFRNLGLRQPFVLECLAPPPVAAFMAGRRSTIANRRTDREGGDREHPHSNRSSLPKMGGTNAGSDRQCALHGRRRRDRHRMVYEPSRVFAPVKPCPRFCGCTTRAIAAVAQRADEFGATADA